jgi:Up-Regulated in long-lived daf-2
MSDYNTSTQISVRNNFSETVSITLTHQYSDDAVYTQTWNDVAPGAVTTPWKVEYNTGFGRTGKDHWNITVTSGVNTWQNATKDKQCTLKSDDADTVLVFGVSASSFDLNMNSPSCDDAMTFNGYNRCTQISVLSTFPDAVTVTLTHQYAGDPATTQTWQGVTDGQATSRGGSDTTPARSAGSTAGTCLSPMASRCGRTRPRTSDAS